MRFRILFRVSSEFVVRHEHDRMLAFFFLNKSTRIIVWRLKIMKTYKYLYNMHVCVLEDPLQIPKKNSIRLCSFV